MPDPYTHRDRLLSLCALYKWTGILPELKNEVFTSKNLIIMYALNDSTNMSRRLMKRSRLNSNPEPTQAELVDSVTLSDSQINLTIAQKAAHRHLSYISVCKQFSTTWLKRISDVAGNEVTKHFSLILNANIESECIIPIIGGTGHGKSSMLNALHKIGDLAPTSDSGDAGICLPLSFIMKKPEHHAPYTVEYKYLRQENVIKSLTRLKRITTDDNSTCCVLPESYDDQSDDSDSEDTGCQQFETL